MEEAIQDPKEKRAENKMGVMPINKLLLSMSVPMMISMLAQALYNIVDSIFVARLSETALTAVSLAFPVQNLMISVGVGTGVGLNAFLSKSLGEKNFGNANKAATNGVLLGFLNSVIFIIVGLFASEAFFRSQTDIKEIIDYGRSYMFIVCVFSAGLFNQIMMERLLTSCGKTVYSMIIQLVGALTNVILDPILIFGLFGFPRLEVAGAAIATVIGQCLAALLGLYFNLAKNHDIRLSFRRFRPNFEIIKRIYSVGLPAIVMQAIASVMVYGLNLILIAFTETATAIFGVYFKLQSFVFMPVFGLNNGMVPIIAYNYGARNKERIAKTIRLSVAYAVGIMLLGVIIFQVFPAQLLHMFKATDEMLRLGIPALRIISIDFVFAGFCVIFISVLQALGNGVSSMYISIARQLVVLLPVAWLLSLSGSVSLIWWAFPISEATALILISIMMRRIYREKVSAMV